MIVDEFTGRLSEGRRFSEGLHQALEAKEQVVIKEETQTLADITFQNYFRMYDKLAGMTGTAQTEATEFAEIYNLDILDADILDENTNTTRFLIMSRDFKKASDPTKPTMTTLIFEVRSVPAVLYKCLGGFATNNINLTKLESYMLNGSMKAARFYADCEGHIDSPAMKQALEELQFYCTDGGITVLGSYPANRG